jgi:hypothetical protein
MSTFICFDCKKNCLNSFHPEVYRIFPDFFDYTIGNPYYRVCKYCVRENFQTRIVLLFVIIILILIALYCEKYVN